MKELQLRVSTCKAKRWICYKYVTKSDTEQNTALTIPSFTRIHVSCFLVTSKTNYIFTVEVLQFVLLLSYLAN